ncbi:hypothetical protein ABZP36_021271 [Zizania latifolia]
MSLTAWDEDKGAGSGKGTRCLKPEDVREHAVRERSSDPVVHARSQRRADPAACASCPSSPLTVSVALEEQGDRSATAGGGGDDEEEQIFSWKRLDGGIHRS